MNDVELAQWLEKEYYHQYHIQPIGKDGSKKAWLLTARRLQEKQREDVDLLISKLYDIYHQLDKVEVWQASNDLVCDMCEEKCIEIIKSHFFRSVQE